MNTKCKHCGQIFEVEESYTGQEAECPECGKSFIIEPEVAAPSSAGDHGGGEDLILGLYRLKEGPFAGGMGKVYRVHHTGWKVDLAMKQPHARLFETEAQKENFIHECDAWINLGLHPHIVSCYYVREVNGIPSIFSEWMDGGNLTDWIADGKVDTLEKMLDIAIQFAWGLDYAHDQRLIHQDVKPDNVLLTSEGDVKIADFGIANAKRNLTMTASRPVDFTGTMVGEAGAYTPVYAAPEQLAGEQLTRRTDIFSWAMSLVEIGIGGRQWQGTSAAVRTDFDFYMGNTVFPIPSSLKELLRGCLKEVESERPHDFKIIAGKLLEIYREETGKDYPRTIPKSAIDSPDSLNNRALSYIDLGQPEKAEKLWKQALEIDKLHLESTYNRGIYLWRQARIDDMEFIRRLNAVRQDSSWQCEYLLAMVHLDRGDAESALPLLKSAASKSNSTPIVAKAMEIATKLWNLASGKCLRTFGHSDHVTSLSFSPDGKFALSGGGYPDKTLKLWDVASGECLRTFEGHTDSVRSVGFSSDGKFALSGGEDKTLKLWDVASGECLRTFEGHNDRVTSVSFSLYGKFALSGSWDNTMKLWDVASGECLRTFVGHSNRVTSVSFSLYGKFALSGSWDNILKLWDLVTGECLRTFVGHTNWVNSVSFSPDGKFALSGSKDKTLKLWDVVTGQCLCNFEGHTGEVTSVSFSPDGKLALSGGGGFKNDKTLKLWDMASGQCLRTFEGHTGEVTSVSFSPDGKLALSGSWDNTLKLWDVPILTRYADWALCRIRTVREALAHEQLFTKTLQEAKKKVTYGDIAAALALLATARSISGFGQVSQCLELNAKIGLHCHRTGLQNGWLERIFEGHTSWVTSVSFSPDGKFALSGSLDKTLKLWDVASCECLRTFEGHTGSVASVNFSPDGKFVLSGSWDNTMKLWDVASGKCLRTFEKHNGIVNSVSFSPDGKFALSGVGCYPDKPLKLWDVASGEWLRTFEGHKHYVTSVSFSSDGRFALSGSWDKTLKLWDVASGECFHTFEGHKEEVDSVSFSPDGKFVLSGSKDKTLKLWDVASGECFRTFEGHTDSVASVSFSPDGKFVLSGGFFDKALKLWDVASGQCLRTFEGYADRVASVSFSPDGKFALSGNSDNTLKLWRLDWKYEFPGWVDWDDGAEPYLKIFLTLHPEYTEDDFQRLLTDLQNRGYGWLRPEGIRRKLDEMRT